MKLFFALLLIIGYASAVPDPKTMIKYLQFNLEQDLQKIEQHTEAWFLQMEVNIRKNLANENIFYGLTTLIKELSSDINNMMKLAVSDIELLLKHVQTGSNDLKKLVSIDEVPILDDLKNQLIEILGNMKQSLGTLLMEIIYRFFDNMKTIISAPQDTTHIIEDTINDDLRLVIREGQNYVAAIAQVIRDALQKIKEEYE